MKTIPDFYIKYSSDFTEDLFNKFFAWARDNIGPYERDYVPISYEDFKKRYPYIWVNTSHGFKYSQDNHRNSIEKEFTISELTQLIGYTEPNLVGRYVKFLKIIDSKHPIGSYDLIIKDEKDNDTCIVLENYRSCNRHRLTDGDLELMPVGWTPEEPKPTFPEYVECIEDCHRYGIKGRIYKFEKTSGLHWGVICNLDCSIFNAGNTLYFNPHELKPSTKEAYDKQNTPVTTTSTDIIDKVPLSPKSIIERPKEEPCYAYVGDPLPKTKPLIEDVQSVSVNLSTKKKTNKFKF
jgi:hypothetical protein